jgi:hypothetical protein
MLQTKIKKLTPEQEALLPVIREKWKGIALSTERIDRQKATVAVTVAYRVLNLNQPEILFVDSPLAAVNFLESQPKSALGKVLMSELLNQLSKQLDCQIDWKTDSQLLDQIDSLASLPRCQLKQELTSKLKCQEEGNLVYDCIHAGVCLCIASQMDFCISVLNLAHEQNAWLAYKSLMSEGGYIFAFEKMCLVSDRPIKYSIDSEERLHAEAEPAIEFSDGFFRKYVYHGVEIPEKYGKLHPHQWQAQWLLEEKNAEVRRLLIQEIGYDRICTELEAQQLDSEREYTLLRIDDADVEPMYLLKMTCPSTGFIHALRVPPNISSAREAIRWVNWGIDPLEFAIQT